MAKAPAPRAAGGRRPRGRDSATGSTTTASPAAGTSRRRSSQAGLDVAWLDQVADDRRRRHARGRGALAQLHPRDRAADERDRGLHRRASPTLVGAAKQYSQLDRAPYQVVDVHELLDSTLTDARPQDRPASTWSRTTTARCPTIPAYAAELNQVWTNLIDNAVQAMDGAGHADRAHRRGRRRRAAGRDRRHRPGHPATRSRAAIFEPFFTTKPVGEGTGLGLDISWRIVVNKHHGDLSVESRPGRHPVPGPLPCRCEPRPRRAVA